jgi:hypothetical protein
VTIGALLRTALQLLEKDDPAGAIGEAALEGPDHIPTDAAGIDGIATNPMPAMRAPASTGEETPDDDLRMAESHSKFSQSRREWAAAERDNRCVVVSGESMAPIVADGASVAYAKNEEDVLQLDGKLVVVWLDNQPVVRWLEHCGRFALLRAANPSTVPQQVLVDLEDPKQRPQLRRVLWVNTPH